ncbi:MAG: peptidase M42 [Myxococcota bacterium]
MPEEQFALMRDVLGAPSPVGLEGAMTYGVIKPYFESFAPQGWTVHQFAGNAGVILDSHPGRDDMLTAMVVGHADKIRLQVRSIGDDGKIWINSDSFLPMTLIGHEVLLFSEDPANPGSYRVIEGGTVEAIGAIHFASEKLRTGSSGIRKDMLYLELQIHGSDKKKQIEQLGIRPGNPILLNRKIKRGFSPDTFYGAYLDNGLGCFVTIEVARLLAERGGLSNIRTLFTIATHEEIGRMGSRVQAGSLKPDVLIAVDVSHDFVAAPGIKERRMTPLRMGGGFTMAVGSIVSEQLNTFIEKAANTHSIPMQRYVVGRDTGTDGMAAVFAGVDAAAASIGFPIRNMHTISETGHTGDVLAAIHGIAAALQDMDTQRVSRDTFKDGHPRLDQATALGPKPR